MSYLNKNSLLKTVAAAALVSAFGFGCATPKYGYHMEYKLSSCGKPVTRENVNQGLVKRGFLHSADIKGPLDIFHRPDIIKKGALAQEPYEDRAGDIAVAVCPGGSENYIVTEEWRSCKDRKDCTAENQHEIRKLAEDWSCQVSEKASHSKKWDLEDRQDWTKESCSFIVTNLSL